MSPCSTLTKCSVIALSVGLVACGGGGGSAITSPITSTAVTPPPTPTPPPGPQNFDTAEYRRSTGLDNINALAAYNAGGTGDGVIIAVVDSGIDINNAEFAGRIHPESTNTANPGTTFQDQDGHGTFTASIAAGDNNGVGSHGVAFDSQILALRTDDDGSCAGVDGCSHFDVDIAEAVDIAANVGAKVANLSLGGGGAAFSLRSSINRATQDGLIVVISAGNDGRDQPDEFALVAQTGNANGRVLIAGYVDDTNTIDPNSNRAGSAADVFVVAPGTDVLATGLNGQQFLVSGSSFSAPHVSGAIAVLYDLFPNLTADEMIDLITSTATDLGAPGVDAVYGHGLINLEAAIQPQGTLQTSVASANGAVMAPLNSGLQTPSAFGDALAAGLSGQRITSFDRFNRAYDVNLAPFAQAQQPQVGLSGILNSQQNFAHSALSANSGALFAQVSVREETPLPAHLLASFSGAFADRAERRDVMGRMQARFDDVTLSATFGLRPDPVLTPGGEQSLISLRDSDATTYGLGSAPSDGAIRAEYALTPAIGISIEAAWAQRLVDPSLQNTAFGPAQDSQMRQSAISLHYDVAADTSFAITLGAIEERGQIFGALANDGALSLGSGANTLYAQTSLRQWLGASTYVSAEAAYGTARLRENTQASLLQSDGTLAVSSWSMGLRSNSALKVGDAAAFTISQPQRVESGTAQLLTGEVTRLSLAPTGRQIDTELAYQFPLSGWGTLSANALMRRDLGHVDGQHDVAGFVRLTSHF